MAKTDMERIGVFSQSGYTTIGDPYRSPSSGKWQSFCSFNLSALTIICALIFIQIFWQLGTFNESAMKGKQMLIGGTKAKTATQSGYFGKSFDRIQEVFLNLRHTLNSLLVSCILFHSA